MSFRFELLSFDQVEINRILKSTEKNGAARWDSGVSAKSAQTLTSVKNSNFVMKKTTVLTL